MLKYLFNKVVGHQTPTKVFFCEYCEIFKNSFFKEHLWSLLLSNVAKNFAKFTGKKQCWSLFNKLASLQPANVLKRETPAQIFSCKVCKNFMNRFFAEHL